MSFAGWGASIAAMAVATAITKSPNKWATAGAVLQLVGAIVAVPGLGVILLGQAKAEGGEPSWSDRMRIRLANLSRGPLRNYRTTATVSVFLWVLSIALGALGPDGDVTRGILIALVLINFVLMPLVVIGAVTPRAWVAPLDPDDDRPENIADMAALIGMEPADMATLFGAIMIIAGLACAIVPTFQQS